MESDQMRLSHEALSKIPVVDEIVMECGQSVPLRSLGSRTATTARQVRARGQAYNVGRADDFRVGMDINLLIKELHQNTLRHICVEDNERTRLFADPEVRILAAALIDNTSVISLRLPGCYATDASLIPLFRSLLKHPSIRSVDVSDTKGSEASGRALVDLVCKNTQIVHVGFTNIRLSSTDALLLEEALRFNCFYCHDPGRNPYDASLIRYVDQSGKSEREVMDQINLSNPWMVDINTGEVKLHVLENIARFFSPSEQNEDLSGVQSHGNVTHKKRGRKHKVSFEDDFEVHRQVCDDYMNGKCRYGSRCKYLHPELTSATLNRIVAARAIEEEDRAFEQTAAFNDDARTTVLSKMSTRRLRGRTTSTFKFDPRKVTEKTRKSDEQAAKVHEPNLPKQHENRVLVLSVALTVCAAVTGLIFLRKK